jgi:hypothetical protein
LHPAFLQKGFCAPAIGTPGGAVDGNGFHVLILPYWMRPDAVGRKSYSI